jgi:hypothetical protein
MSQSAGTVYADIRIQLDSLQNDINAVKVMFSDMSTNLDKQLKKNTKTTNNLKETITALSTAFLAVKGAVSLFVGALKGAFDWINKQTMAYNTQQAELAKLNAVIQSTGAIAWTTGKNLMEMAGALSTATGFVKTDIMKMQAVLIGFRGITGETFERTTKAVLDMATVMGGDLISTANSLGKALDTPIQGMNSLARQAIVFSNADKEMVKQMVLSGDMLGARNIILEEIEKSFSGTAEVIKSATESLSAFNRLNAAKEEQAVQRGRQTTGFSAWWSNWRAAYKEADAAWLKVIQDAEDAKNRIDQILQARQKLNARINTITHEMAHASGEDLENMKDGLQMLNLEFERLNLLAAEGRAAIALKELQDAWSIWAGQMGNTKESLEQFEKSNFAAEVIKNYKEATKEVKQMKDCIIEIETINSNIKEQRETEAAQLKIATDEIKKIREVELNREKTVKGINELYARGAIDIDEYYSRMVSAYQAEAMQINEIYVNAKYLETTEENIERVRREANISLSEAIRLQLALNAASQNHIMSETQFLNERKKIMDLYENRMLNLHNIYIGLDRDIANNVEYEKEALAIRQQQVIAMKNLIEQVKANNAQYPQTFEILQEITEEYEKQEQSVKRRREDEQLLNEANDLQLKRLQIGKNQFELEKDNLKIQEELLKKKVEDGEISQWVADLSLQAIRNYYKAQQEFNLNSAIEEHEKEIKAFGKTSVEVLQKEREEMLKTAEQFKDMEGYDKLIKGINTYYNLLTRQHYWEEFKKQAQEAMRQVGELFSAFSELKLAQAKRETDNQIKEWEKQHEKYQEHLDAELQARLFAAGLADAATSEQHEVELSRAKSTGDHRLIWEAEQARKKYEIEKDIAKQKEKAEDEYRKRKAEEEHKYALLDWKMQIAAGYVNAAQAILVASTVKPWPAAIAAMAVATAVGAAQIATIHTNKPQKQFDTGGIVAADPYRGDNTPIMARGREMFLRQEDQANLFDMIRAGGNNSQPIMVHTVIELDGEVLAEKIFNLGSTGNAFINARGVV